METPGPVTPAAPRLDDAAPETPPETPPGADGPVWRFLVTPRWLGWHLFTVAAVWGMLLLGDWQFHRAMTGNGLSWAYTFEWPLFAGFGIVFWARTIRDEFRLRRGIPLGRADRDAAGAAVNLPDGAVSWEARQPADQADDAELASYNAYLAKLNAKAEGQGK